MARKTLFQPIAIGREIKLNSKYNMDKWGLIAKEQVRGWWMENYLEETLRVGEFLLN